MLPGSVKFYQVLSSSVKDCQGASWFVKVSQGLGVDQGLSRVIRFIRCIKCVRLAKLIRCIKFTKCYPVLAMSIAFYQVIASSIKCLPSPIKLYQVLTQIMSSLYQVIIKSIKFDQVLTSYVK